MLGPGVVWLALAQGSGELIWWPYLIAKYGLGFLFLLLPACLAQWPLTFEIGRYTALTGEGIWQGFLRLDRRFALLLWLLMLFSFLWFGAFASAGGTALAALTGLPSGWSARGQSLFWAYTSIAVFLACLVLSPVLYRFIERFMFAVALVTLIGLLGACTEPEILGHVPRFLRGLVVPERPLPRPWDPNDASILLTAVAFAGLGGFWTLFYSYWTREKGVAMAHYAGRMTGLLGHAEAIDTVGSVPVDEPGSVEKLRRWQRFLVVDSGVGVVGNVATTLMTCLLAYALLTPTGLVPEGWEIAVVQSRFFEARWGEWGAAAFLLVSAAFLSDTWLSTADAICRVNTDIVYHLFPRARRRSMRWWYFCFLAIVTLATCVTMPLAQPGPLIILSAVTGFFGTVIYAIAVLLLNHRLLPRHLPAAARPGRWSMLAMGLSCLTYLVCAVLYGWIQARRW